MSPTASKILVVEDETNVAETLVERLRSEGNIVEWARTGLKAIELSKEHRFELALLDVGLPDLSGFEVARDLRARSPSTAIVFLTAFANPEDRVKGLELGAEDYVVKPFHFKELLLRIQNALKRAHYLAADRERFSTPVQIGKARVNFSRFEAETGGKTQPLTHKECAVLRLLLEKRGTAVSRDEILNHAWSAEEFPTSRTVDNFVVRLRKLVETDVENPRVIRSIRGVGYLLSPEEKPEEKP